MSNSIYQQLTDKIIGKLKEGTVSWKASWKGVGFPKNAITKKYYRGINLLLLYIEGYNSPYWLTFKQAKDLGGIVKAGEKGTTVIYWQWLKKKDPDSDKIVKIPILKKYTVFNALQREGLNLNPQKSEVTGEIKECESIISEFLNREPELTLEHTRAVPFYLPQTDFVNVPPIENFKSKEDYYLTLFHELTHVTGHPKRLGRGLLEPTGFGSKEYSKEELIAELGACFLSGHAGIEAKTLDDSASYIDGWIKALSGDTSLIVQAGAKAQHAVDYILGLETN